MNYVIIGNSAAAIGCVEGIRSVDTVGKITIISNEKYHTYSRPLISYLLCEKTDEQRMKYRPDDFYKKNKCKLMANKEVIGIDYKNKKVVLKDGETVNFDKLFVGTGSSPFVPSMEGFEHVKNKFSFMSLDDAHALQKALKPDSKVLIIGAGLIGLKCAEGIYGKCGQITVVDLADRILTSILDIDGAAMVQKHIESKGIKFELNTSVDKFLNNTAYLKNGEKIDFDIVVVAVGVKPNISLIKEIGGEINRGIVTDCYCKTSLDDIYAGGDCAESYDVSSGQNRVLALLPLAYIMGNTAGKNMAGEKVLYNKAIPMNAIGFFGLHIITAGCYDGVEYIKNQCGSYKKMFTKGGKLKGYILIGDVARAGIYTSLIREQMPLSSIDFELIAEKPQLMGFASAKRVEILSK